MTKKKVALLLHGIVGVRNRHGELVDYSRSLKTHINNLKNNNTCECDIFLHFWQSNEMAVDDKKILSDFNPKKHITIKQPNFGIGKEHAEIFQKKYRHRRQRFGNIDACIYHLERDMSLITGLKLANDLKTSYELENHFKYDFVIKSRFDCLLGYKPNFYELDSRNFYSLPYNKHKKIFNNQHYKRLTDFFWITGSENMNKLTAISDVYKDLFKNDMFLQFYDGMIENAWIWHMIETGLYEKIRIQDFVESPISLDRFFNKNNKLNEEIRQRKTGCLPFTGWSRHKTYEKDEFINKMNIIEQKIKNSIEGVK